jgi:uncharacterized MnhB-related membrane protein
VTPLHVAALAVVAVTGTVVVLTRDPLKQLVMAGFSGVALALLFFVFGAPDVAMSQIVVSAVVVPLVGLLTLARMREHQERE